MRNKKRKFLSASRVFVLLLFCIVLQSLTASRAYCAEVDFNRDIRPILANKCMNCHGPDEEHREADLSLLSEKSAKENRDGVAVIKPGDANASSLIKRIETDDADLKMPPPDLGKGLSAKEIAILKQWIDSGANWAEHWAYVLPKKKNAPQTKNTKWNKSYIDQFLLQKMAEHQLQPSDEADRVTLIRRLYFDLTGLPPRPADVDAFLKDASPQAYEKVVAKLLASKHFGEQLAVYWLDLVRFADTVGYHGDQQHNISPYRDWVINAFNNNMKFDQFTREQLAGDLLPGSTIDQKIASGYNRMLQTSHEGGLQPKEYLSIYAADRIRNLSAVWMGATLGCAQCHDHKYDPYTSKDFYSMQAFFADLDEAQHFTKGKDRTPTPRPPEIILWDLDDQKKYEKLEVEITETEKELMLILEQIKKEIVENKKIDDKKTDKADEAIKGEKVNEAAQEKEASQPPAKTIKSVKADFDKRIKLLRKQRDTVYYSQTRSMISSAIEPRIIRILPRGNWLDETGEIVAPAIPNFLGELETSEKRATRLDLANWLVDDKKGKGLMTARVFVNRLWYLMFGSGLADLSDFGGQGETPTHPELLDRLAIDFVESGWDVKYIIRQIVSSQAYRQQSLVSEKMQKIDPLNKWFSRQGRYRLPAESIRDNALAISGLLVTDIGGESVRPYQPTGYYRHLNFPKRTYKHDQNSQQWRRGVYVHWQRQFLHPMMKAFDAPSREECTAKRPRSNTPLAALTLLNDPTFLEAARVFAARIIIEGGNTSVSKINFAYKEALSRLPDEIEQKLILQTYKKQLAHYAAKPEQAKKLQSVGMSASPKEVDAIELAAWTQIARILLNLNETTTRN